MYVWLPVTVKLHISVADRVTLADGCNTACLDPNACRNIVLLIFPSEKLR